MTQQDSSVESPGSGVSSRRTFIKSSAAAGAGTLAAGTAPSLIGQTRKGKKDLNVAIVGAGQQGGVLLDACGKIPNIHFKALCDIWPYRQKSGTRRLQRQKHDVTPYTDYEDMLERQKDIDAVIIATPDFMHAPITNACLKAGKDVYCEKLMSNSIEAAKSMVQTARETKHLLQIGHQRRSNPRYLHVKNNLIDEAQFLGRITQATSFWNRGVKAPVGVNPRYNLDQATLTKYGYKSMEEFLNWRNYGAYGGGPISDLGAHQIDIFNWWLDTDPSSVIAGGGIDYYEDTDQYDNVVAIFEFKTKKGTVRCEYHVFTTTAAGGGYNEYFMGDHGAIRMSENDKWTKAFRETTMPGQAEPPPWDDLAKKGWITAPKTEAKKKATVVDVRESAELATWTIPVKLDKAIHQPHLENFFAAVRGETTLTSPAETSFKTAVTVLTVNQSIAEGRKIEFKSSDFEV